MSAMLSPFFLHGKDVGLPGGQVHKQPPGLQFVSIAVVTGGSELILQPPQFALQILERQPQAALTLMGSVVHRDEQRLATRPMPGEAHEAIVRQVSVPGGGTFDELPLAVADYRLTYHRQQAIIK